VTTASLGGRKPAVWPAAARTTQLLALASAFACACVAALSGSVIAGWAAFALTIVIMSTYVLRTWRAAATLLLLVILFIPIKRYSFPVSLPFDLEPYRVLVAALVLVWAGALLINPQIRFVKTGLEWPIFAWFVAILISMCVNFLYIDRANLAIDTLKSLSFLLSFVLVFLLLCSVLRTRDDIELLVRVLVGGGAVVGFAALFEYNTGYNVFNHLSSIIPVIRFEGLPAELAEITRDDRLRVYASAQHPIALAAALVMLLPLGAYLALSTRRVTWWLATFLIGIGALSTLSRTGVVMFVASAITFVFMRPRESRRLVPLIVPAFLVIFVALPHALGSFESVFFPKGGLIADQSATGRVGNSYHSGRLATLGPGLAKWEKHPIAGRGFGTTIIDPTNPSATNSNIQDDQWLDALIETGVLGVGTFLWLIVRSTRLLRRAARSDDSSDGLLAGALASSIVGFAVGMFTFDAFSFIQVTFFFFVMLALSGALLVLSRDRVGAGGTAAKRLPRATG
jgi:polysaccharide biosynthesis protein PslJ